MPDNKLKTLYQGLQEEGMTDKTLEEFSSEYSTPEKQAFLYQGLQEEGMTDKTLEEFSNEYFSEAVEPKGVKAESQDGGFQFLSASTNASSESEQPKPFSNISDESLSLYEEYRGIVGGTITSTQRQEIDGRIETELKTRKLPAYRDVFEAKGEDFDSYEDMSLDSFKETEIAKEREKELLQSFREKNRREFLESLSDEEKTTLNGIVETNYTSLKESNKLKIAENEIKANYLRKLEEEVSQYQGKTLDQLSQEDKNNLLELSDKYTDVYNAYALNLDEINEDLEDLGTFEQERDMLLRTTSQMENLQHKAFGSVFRFLSNATNFIGGLPMGGTTNIPIKTAIGQSPDEDLFPILREIADGYDSLQKPKLDFNSIQSPSELFTWGIETTVEQTGNLLASATGNPYVTFLAVGSSAGGSKKDELRKSNESGATNYTEEQIQTAGLFSFVVEGGTGLVTGSSLNAAKRTFKAAIGSLKGGTVDLTKKALVKQALKSTGTEVVEETSAQLLDNIFHIGYLEDKERHIFDGLAESATGAIFTSGAINTLGTGAPLVIAETSKAVRNNAQRKEFKGNKKRIQELVDEVNALPEGDVLREKLEPKIKELQKKNEQIIKDNVGVLEKLTPQNINEIIKSDKKVKTLLEEKKSIEESKNISEETKKELIEDNSSEILNEVKNKEYVVANSGFDTKIRKKAQEIAYNKKVKQAEEQGSKDKPVVSKKDIDQEYEVLLEDKRKNSFDHTIDNTSTEAVNIAKETGKEQVAFEQGKGLLESSNFYKKSDIDNKKRLQNYYKADFYRKLGKDIPVNAKDKFKKLYTDFNKKIVDKYFEVKQEFEDKAGDSGVDISKKLKLFSSKQGNKIEEFYKTVEYTFESMKLEGITGKDLSDYMMAIHAPEANAMGLKHSGKEATSGLTDTQAKQILEDFEKRGVSDKLQSAAKSFNRIIEDTRKARLDAGLISDTEYNDLVGLYENYVPLQGFADGNIKEEEFIEDLPESNKLSVKGNEIKNRSGRSTKADNVISNILNNYTKAVLRAEKNILLAEVAKTVLKSKGLGEVVTSKELGITDKLPDNTVGFKENGEQKYIVFESKALARTLNNSDTPRTNKIIRFLKSSGIYLSQMMTGRNIDFFIPNFVRDGQSSFLGLMSDLEKKGYLKEVDKEDLYKEVGKNTFKVMKTLYKNERGNSSQVNEFGKFLNEYKESGAKTSFANVKNLDTLKKDLENLDKAFNQKKIVARTKKGVDNVLSVLDGISSTLENSYRFSTFIALRKRGVDIESAAVVAKGLSVDFNQSGELGSILNGVYLFFNAAVQSSTRVIDIIKPHKDFKTGKYKVTMAQKMLLSQIPLAAMITAYNIGMSEEDEDGKTFYEKIPQYEKDTNFIIMNPLYSKKYFKIPMQYGFNIFPTLGSSLAEVAGGTKTFGQASGDWVASSINGLSPVSGSNSKDEVKTLLDVIVPTLIKPIAVDLAVNENFFGTPIYKENPYNKLKPDSELGKNTTSGFYKTLAKGLNYSTGGDEFEKGVFDFHPESIEYLVDFALGGVGATINRSIKSIENAVDKDKEVSIKDIPILRRFFGEVGEYFDYQEFNTRKDKLTIEFERLKRDFIAAKGKEKEDLRKEGKKIQFLINGFNNTSKTIKKFYKEKLAEETKVNPDFDRVKRIEEAINKKIKKANLEYNNKLGKLK